MIFLEADTIDEIYPKLCGTILEEGHELAPRGLKTLDLGTVGITIHQPWKRIITNKVRRINPFFLFAEFIWIITQQNRVDTVSFYNRKMDQFSDDGRTLYGAYGPRLMWQLPYIVNKIKLDRSTRQAIASIYNPKDQQTVTKDFPCNIILHFLPKDDSLDLNVYVRSQDILLGFPYDFYHWSLLQEMVASEVGMNVGSINWICGSLHGYERDNKKLGSIANSGKSDTIEIEEPMASRLPQSLREISAIEFRNRKSDITEVGFRGSLEEIRSLHEDQVIRDQLGTLLYYRVRLKDPFGIPKGELLEATGAYKPLLEFQGWNV